LRKRAIGIKFVMRVSDFSQQPQIKDKLSKFIKSRAKNLLKRRMMMLINLQRIPII